MRLERTYARIVRCMSSVLLVRTDGIDYNCIQLSKFDHLERMEESLYRSKCRKLKVGRKTRSEVTIRDLKVWNVSK